MLHVHDLTVGPVHVQVGKRRRLRLLPVLLGCLALMAPRGSFAADTSLRMDSPPGDYVGGGLFHYYTGADGTFTASGNYDQGVSLSYAGPGMDHWWYLDFAAPGDQPLAVGTYAGAARFPFQSADQPGLAVYGDGRGCNELSGSFEVKQVVYGTGGEVLAFWATFEQVCELFMPPLQGEIRYNADAPAYTATLLASSRNPAVSGQEVTFTATVASGGGTPTGTVRFLDGAAELGTASLSGAPATASLATSSLALGAHAVTAVYGGDGTFPASSSAVLTQTVESPPTVSVRAVTSAAEGVSPRDGSFQVNRTGSTAYPLTVVFTVGGSATPGADYEALGTELTILAGAASAYLWVRPVNDAAMEAPETVEVSLAAGAYAVGSPASATVTLASDDECIAARPLAVNAPHAYRNNGTGSTDVVDSYAGCDWDESGPEYVYSFTAAAAGTYTATLSGLSADLDVFVLDASGLCSGGARLAHGDATVTWTAPAGGTYAIVVDGRNGAAGRYTLTLTTLSSVLWTRSDTGQAALWTVDASDLSDTVPIVGGAYVQPATGVGAPWRATSFDADGGDGAHLLWSRADSGQASLWRVEAAADGTVAAASAVYVPPTAPLGRSWQATSYEHVGATEGYVLWSRADSGQASLWEIDPATGSRTAWVSLKSPGRGWLATGFARASGSEGYVLWSSPAAGKAILCKVDPGTGGLSRASYLGSASGIGRGWEATSYQHVSSTEGYVLWTRSDTGQAVLWKINPGASGTITATDAAYLYTPSGVGAPWAATGFAIGR